MKKIFTLILGVVAMLSFSAKADYYLADWGEVLGEGTFVKFTQDADAGIYYINVPADKKLPQEFKITSSADWNGTQWGAGYWINNDALEAWTGNIAQNGRNIQLRDWNIDGQSSTGTTFYNNNVPTGGSLQLKENGTRIQLKVSATAYEVGADPEPVVYYLADWDKKVNGTDSWIAFTATETANVYELDLSNALAFPSNFKITNAKAWGQGEWGSGSTISALNQWVTGLANGRGNATLAADYETLTKVEIDVTNVTDNTGTLDIKFYGTEKTTVTDYFLASGFGEGETPSFVKFVASENEGEYELALNGTLPAEFKITTSETWEGRNWGSGYWINANVQYNNIPQGGDNMVNKLGEDVVAQKIIISENQDGTLNLKVACAINVDAYYLADWESTEGQTEFHKIAKEEDGTYRLALNGTLPTEFKITNLPTWEGATEWAGGYWIELGNELYTGIPQGGENIQNKLGEAFIAEALVIETGEEGTINLKVEGRYNITTTYYAWAWNDDEEGAWLTFAPVAGEDNLFEATITAVPGHIIFTDNNEWAEGATRWAYSPSIDNADEWYLCGIATEGDGSTTINIEAENVKKIQLRYAGSEKIQVKFVTETQKKGDINGDGSIDGNDVSILLEMVLAGGVSDEQKAVADINGDNSVDGNDVSILLEMVLAGE